MESFGETIRKLREDKELPLRTVAAYLDIDQAILSKVERGKRKPTREQVVKLAKYFKVKENDLLVAWLSDKLVYDLEDEDMALEALQMAEAKVEYIVSRKKRVIDKMDIYDIETTYQIITRPAPRNKDADTGVRRRV